MSVQARTKMIALAYSLLHMDKVLPLQGEVLERPMKYRSGILSKLQTVFRPQPALVVA
jgi:hypothetical protein